MKLLAIDSVFDKCGVAIIADGDIVYHAEKTGKRQQTQQILPMIDEALQATGLQLKELSALAFNRGPGAFSGIRINTAVVQALSFAHDIPCVPVSSLQILAQAGYESEQIEHGYAVLDARMKQVYLGEYQLVDGIMQSVADLIAGSVANAQETSLDSTIETTSECLLDYAQTTDKNLPLVCLATDDKNLLALHDSPCSQQSYQKIVPNAKTLAKIGAYLFTKDGGVSAESALPVYLRNNAWKTLKEQGKG
ncbi:MAG: tRNA (adenosine(37)-N6)-threonylcarbamoyltransferase complex dimerization subunit type 1 TsaB [Pseudomonadales bacterium]|nr:MAG: tRNA (adenosine(37)-N6)-threonylcarbamoyltransferase complex dimerization subunit type 1 TsaB [Pseudomonadales bacterium]